MVVARVAYPIGYSPSVEVTKKKKKKKVAENVDGQTDRPTLAAHARRRG